MSFNEEQKEHIIRSYVEEKKSLHMIAEEYGTYVNKIRRFLKKCGVDIRSNAESQKIALDSGRSEHPTKGRRRTRTERAKIAMGVSKSWDNISPEELQRRSEMSKERWDNMTAEELEAISLSAKRGMRDASVYGSKMEHYLRECLEEADIPVILHNKNLVSNTNLEVDLFLPSYNTAIEIDGPTHFLPIFGEERLLKTMEADRKKIGLLLSNNINILRVKHLSKNASLAKAKKITEEVLKFLDTLDRKAQFKEVEV